VTFCPQLDNTTWLKSPETENEKNLQSGQYLPFSRTDKKLQKVRFLNGSIGVLWFVIKEH